jgi:hypothetical protein
MNRFLLALLVCAACKHSSASSSSTSHTETQTVTDTKTSESGATTTTTTVTEQPGETTTTTEEFGPPTEGEASGSGGGQVLPELPAQDLPASPSATRKLPRHGPLVKRTVTVTKSGGETTQTRTEATQQATGATETHAQAQATTKAQARSASAPSAGCVGASWIWGLGILAFAVAAILGILKFRKPV